MQRRYEVEQACPLHKTETLSPLKLSRCGLGTLRATNIAASSSASHATQQKFSFGTLFGRDFDQFDENDLIALGRLMEDSSTEEPSTTKNHPGLSAGFTYLSQFITHDVSFIGNNEITSDLLYPEQFDQKRSPSLDLDSLYGNGPEGEDKRFYQTGSVKLNLGSTTETGGGVTNKKYENDLPRRTGDSEHDDYRKAVIPDQRNDDNLPLAQTHVAFIKFHNAVVAQLEREGVPSASLFAEARQKVVQHYQSIVLHDFLPKVIDESVLGEVIRTHPLPHFKTEPGAEPFMPVEFALAAFRFGHSLIRNGYSWNCKFPSVRLHELIELTGQNGTLRQSKTLPSNWIIDWTRFYDFSGAGIPRNAELNPARMIQTSLAGSLKPLTDFLKDIKPEQYRSLPVLDLIRGNSVGLPSGQEAAEIFRVAHLKPDDVARGPHKSFLKEKGFDQRTPLWYYILKEAELDSNNRLGPVGSRIVAETFVGLIRASRDSILRQSGGEEKWQSDLDPKKKQNKFHMTDLLTFVKDNNKAWDELNPLGS